ncbi:Xaa-Pro aminopeptidase [Roseivirga ehrenbergii]|uniref:Xaa-Pro aminopeptidase n=1 Tax=Roseivirga ehrenbergii (strain DSM 102268 / JCM 13514 / KCTC 12282 / NCIMB 14502 / KMM 6017) TaxID=279360 RepID=A0A150WYR9_ROSEK|nr:aminopeptidase P N-terminal domain-containing protein [Roseivirga ehrenbergii]KYG71432.1 xaa-pro aminopeptidase [Roseivirga ehrenbergii]TCK99518.1 Xaa-Pro aminopeptidase [Roseivirga ehrenbergii]
MKFSIKTLAILMTFMFSGFFILQAQENVRKDYLSADFHKGRRDALRAKLPDNSVAVFFANPVRNRANDVDFIYHQDPDLYYLTGYKEPHAVLLVFKNMQTDKAGNQYNEIFFVQTRNAQAEQWTGRRLGSAGAQEKLGILNSFNNTEFKAYDIDFEKFDKILFYEFQNDVRDNARDESDLFSLIQQFKSKVGYGVEANNLGAEPKKNNLDLRGLNTIMGELRGIKTKDELDLLRKAVFISAVGQAEVMKAMHPGMTEAEVQGIHEFVFKKYGSEYEGYPSIVGAGNNGCILHYIENTEIDIQSDQMILMDLGAEYHGYTADVTRTIPIDGKFSKEEKAIYDLVYEAQEQAIQMAKPGVSMAEMGNLAKDIINKGLAKLGIIESENTPNRYFPHGLSHHIGLDVHDKGPRGPLQENMVITVEPGIYIPDGSKCDPKWWGIAVRIEDDILITKDGSELLSGYAPRKSEDIEALMKQSSPLAQFTLPALKGNK